MKYSKRCLTLMAGIGIGVASASGAQAQSWQGVHIGAFAGLAQSDNVVIDVDGFAGPGPGFESPADAVQPGPGARFPYDDSSVSYGVLAGYDWQFGRLVAGIEIDFTIAGNEATTPIDVAEADETAFTNYDHISTLRGRVGWANDTILVFGTAGVALGSFENAYIDIDQDENGQYTIHDTDDSYLDQRQDFGLVIGGGAEIRIARHWQIRLEGQYLDFGTSRNIVNQANDAISVDGTQNFDVENEMVIVRAGLTYKF